MREIEGANAIVTGASHGLGIHIALELAAAGVHLVLAARTENELEATAQRCRTRGVSAVAIPTDLSFPEEVQALAKRAEDTRGPIDILVNNAALETIDSFSALDPAAIERTVAVNVTAPLLLTRHILPGMLERGRGHVVNLSSLGGMIGIPFQQVYSATKFALLGFTQGMRFECHGTGVGFSAVCPGFVKDDGIFARMEDEGAHRLLVPGATTPEKVAEAVCKAIIEDIPELVVNPIPLRPLLALASLFPPLREPIVGITGTRDMYRDLASHHHSSA